MLESIFGQKGSTIIDSSLTTICTKLKYQVIGLEHQCISVLYSGVHRTHTDCLDPGNMAESDVEHFGENKETFYS